MAMQTIGEAAAHTGWSARMLRYLETVGLVVPTRTEAGYRVYGESELGQLRDLRLLRERFGLELDEVALRPGSGATPSCASPSTPGCARPVRAPTGSSGSSESTSG